MAPTVADEKDEYPSFHSTLLLGSETSWIAVPGCVPDRLTGSSISQGAWNPNSISHRIGRRRRCNDHAGAFQLQFTEEPHRLLDRLTCHPVDTDLARADESAHRLFPTFPQRIRASAMSRPQLSRQEE
jgi:hypothetical protein